MRRPNMIGFLVAANCHPLVADSVNICVDCLINMNYNSVIALLTMIGWAINELVWAQFIHWVI